MIFTFADRVVSKDELLDTVWGTRTEPGRR
jgi:hypothetical protein